MNLYTALECPEAPSENCRKIVKKNDFLMGLTRVHPTYMIGYEPFTASWWSYFFILLINYIKLCLK